MSVPIMARWFDLPGRIVGYRMRRVGILHDQPDPFKDVLDWHPLSLSPRLAPLDSE